MTSKPGKRFPFADGTRNRFGKSSLGSGLSASNSNTRIVQRGQLQPTPSSALSPQVSTSVNLGLNSERSRGMMIERLRRQGITDERVLAAMQLVPRHLFVDQGLASRAYEEDALPIGFAQTISQPWVVAHMISLVCDQKIPNKVLEVGAGCGYQAAVLAQLVKEVYAIERIKGLCDMARDHMRQLGLSQRARIMFGDGMQGYLAAAPYDAIVVAAAGPVIPRTLLEQLTLGGRLIAPEGTAQQRLVLVERTGQATWRREELDAVRFVPMRAGTQI